MKETNMEHFRGEIEALMARCEHATFAIRDGEPTRCLDTTCRECEVYISDRCSDANRIKWLMSEYKPEPVLTAREKHFVEAINNGFISSNKPIIYSFHKMLLP